MSAETTATGRGWIAIAGFVACLAFLVSFGVAFGAPEAIRNDETILDWYRDSANQYRFVLAAFIAGIGTMAFLVFVIGLKKLLLELNADDVLIEVAYAAGLIVVAMTMVEVAIGSSVAGTLIFSDAFELEPETARLALTIGNVWIGAFAGIPSALFMACASLASRRSGLLPAWLAWTGFVLAFGSLLIVPGFGLNGFLVLVWVLLAGIVLLRGGSRARTQAPLAH